MNYSEQYNKLIQTRKERILLEGVYYEKHHIIPKSLGGSNCKDNLVHLTPREHYIAHLLLWKNSPENCKLFWPLQWFFDKDGVRIPSRIVQMIKQDRSKFTNIRDYSWTKDLVHRTKMSMIARNNAENYSYRKNDDYKTIQSTNTKNNYIRGVKTSLEKEILTGRFANRPVIVDGVYYQSLSSAARHHNISPKSAYNRLNKDTWANWKYN